MKDVELERFFAVRDKVIDNLQTLLVNLNEYIDQGLEDTESVLYNQIDGFIDDTEAIDNYPELEGMIMQGKAFERILDGWLSSQGRSSVSLDWPKISQG